MAVKFEALNTQLYRFSWTMGDSGTGHYALDAPATQNWDGQTMTFRMNIAGNMPASIWENYVTLVKNSYGIVGARLYQHQGYVVHMDVVATPKVNWNGNTDKGGNFVFKFSSKDVGTVNDAWIKNNQNRIELIFVMTNSCPKLVQ